MVSWLEISFALGPDHNTTHESNNVEFVLRLAQNNPLNMNAYVAYACSYAHTWRPVNLLISSQETAWSTLLLRNVPFLSVIMWFGWKQTSFYHSHDLH